MALILKRLATSQSLKQIIYARNLIASSTFKCDNLNFKSYSQIAKQDENRQVGEAKPIGEKIKETAKTTSYLGVIVAGITVTGFIFFTIFKELFSNNSPQAIYGNALEKCKDHPRVKDLLGQPIKGFGEESSRRRRNHVAHQIYEKNNTKYMRLSFHIQGIRNKATVHCEMKENKNGDYDYRYLFIQTDNYPHETVIIEDNRANDLEPTDQKNLSLPQSL